MSRSSDGFIEQLTVALQEIPQDEDSDDYIPGVSADPLVVEPPDNMHASSVPEVRMRRPWQAAECSGTMNIVLRRSTEALTLLWDVGETDISYEFWIELSAPTSGVRSAWFNMGRAARDGSRKNLTIPTRRLGFDILKHQILIEITPA